MRRLLAKHASHRELLDHRMPGKLLTLCHYWVALLVSTWIRISSVCFALFYEVADMEARLGPAGRYVDPVFQQSRRHYVDFFRYLKKAGSVGFVEVSA